MIKSTLNINENNFTEDAAKKLIVMTATEQAFILSMVESLEAQASSLKDFLRLSGFDHYHFCTDNPRTVARLQLTYKPETND
jgi:hypothetical protein